MGERDGKGLTTMEMQFRIALDVLSARLRTARTNLQITQDAAATALGLSRTTIVAIEAGKRSIAPTELRAFAQLYALHEGDLLADDLPSLQLDVRYRSLNTVSAESHQQEAALLLHRLASSAVELEQILSLPRPTANFPTVAFDRDERLEDVAEDAALELRQRLGLGIGPIQDIFGVIESDLGIRIFERALPPDVSGAMAVDPTHGAFILLNSKHSVERNRNTAAHEIGHVLLGKPGLAVHFEADDYKGREEKFCDMFGRSFLMPSAAVRRKTAELRAISGDLKVRQVLVMALYFGVSMEAMFRRLEALKLLPDGSYESIKSKGLTTRQLERVRVEIGEVKRSRLTPKTYLLALSAYERELLSEQQISHMLALDIVEIRRLLNEFPTVPENAFDLVA